MTSGRSTSTSSSGGSLLAIDLSVTCGTMPPTSSPFAVLLALVDEAASGPARFVFQLVVGKCRGQQPLAGERERHAAGVDRDPAPPPLLRHVGGRAAAARRVEHEIAGSVVISMQRWITLSWSERRRAFCPSKGPDRVSVQMFASSKYRKVVQHSDMYTSNCAFNGMQSIRCYPDRCNPFMGRFPVCLCLRRVSLTFEM